MLYSKNMIIDTHAHLNFKDFDTDIDQVIERCLNNDIWVINIGSDYKTSRRAVEISNQYSNGIYSSVGLHPIHLKTKDDFFDYNNYKKLAKNSGVVAIGETGLDYYYKPKTKSKIDEFKERQKSVLLEHLFLASELKLPVIFHCRMAHYDMISILKEQKEIRGVIHCFTGSIEDAFRYLDLGLYLGFTGIIFKLNLEDVIKKIPSDRILIETDCPYLTPPSKSGRNEPLYLKEIIFKIADLRGVSEEEIEKISTNNAKKLFRL